MDVAEKLIAFMSRYIDLTPEEEVSLLKVKNLKKVDKGSLLLTQGSIVDQSFMVLSGIICRQHRDQLENITVLDLYADDYPIIPQHANKTTPSECELISLKPSILAVSDPAMEEDFLSVNHRFERVCRLVAEDSLSKTNHAYDNFRRLNAEQRYRYLAKTRPQLLQEIPQYVLANYIGVKPESLSRIRGRLRLTQSS